ncbi:MAG TPA: hypothetical protein VJT16_01600 [Streptosporangiaceae bacterium]|nr:hypothetical protein [Streptosporangiaceae bacterium]
MAGRRAFAPRGGAAGDVREVPPGGEIRPATTGRWTALAVCACYLAAALILTWRLWPDPASRTVDGNPTDADLFAWYLRYAADSVAHGHLPALVTTAMNAPFGVNMMWNTSILLPGVLLTPVTLLFGPQVSLSVLTLLGFAGSAAALYYVLRRWQVSVGAAALGGAVYGFSPALLQSALGHYNLQFAVLPPLIIDAGLAIVVGRSARSRGTYWLELRGKAENADSKRLLSRVPAVVWDGLRLGLLVAAQLFISEELALLTAIAGVVLVIGLAVFRPAAAARRAGPAAGGLLVAAIVAFCLAGHALWTQFSGRLVQHGPLFPPDYYVNDPVNFVTPASNLLFHSAGTAATAAKYQGGATEYLAYLGWPLIIALVLAAVVTWRKPAGRAAAFTLAVLVVFSLGGHPLIGGTPSPAVNLPWHWIEEHQLLASVLPDRFSIVADGVAAALLAFGVDAASGRLRELRWQPGFALSAAALCCLPLLPTPLAAGTVTPLPAGWTTAFTALHLRSGAAVLIVPVPTNILTAAMRWQAESGQPDSIVGGYFIGPGAGGQAYIGGNGVSPVSWYLDELWASGLPDTSPFAAAALGAGLPVTLPGGTPAPIGKAPSIAQVRAILVAWHPAAIVAVAAASSPLAAYLVKVLGPPNVQSGTVLAWRR